MITQKFFMLEMQDNSMFPRIEKGDILWFERTNVVNNGDTVVALVKGDDTGIVRKIFVEANFVELYATNGDYQSKRYYRDEIEVVGRVLYIVEEPRYNDELGREMMKNKRIKKEPSANGSKSENAKTLS